ncbi:DJ-1/PfpI family protein [Candidatus Gracilibacteria bacterium]|nr:DJ-1/PfpI family protein [Candidatus Gracilibacteria bacterium]NJM89045.1 DJ-1/PfpI family protein [Hydrococcus sp. RU_2_2]NJP19088.1 DJ-1/PfpI family protein [Hydrococcus sp. CRU_1_1]
MTRQTQYQIGLLTYPGMTQLDITGPYQVLALMPNTRVHLVWKTLELVTSNEGLTILPTTTFDNCPILDVVCVPGGGMGQIAMMRDSEVLTFLQQQAKNAKYITSVCSGSLILAAAGLLQGYRAACHWAFRDQLAMLGVEVGTERVVVDRNRITGGGVTAGIDFGLILTAQLYDEETAKTIQLLLEYNPAPPFDAGSPELAGDALVKRVQHFGKELIAASLEQTKQLSIQNLQ